MRYAILRTFFSPSADLQAWQLVNLRNAVLAVPPGAVGHPVPSNQHPPHPMLPGSQASTTFRSPQCRILQAIIPDFTGHEGQGAR